MSRSVIAELHQLPCETNRDRIHGAEVSLVRFRTALAAEDFETAKQILNWIEAMLHDSLMHAKLERESDNPSR